MARRMALLDIRQRAGYLFLAVMLGHVLLISAQVNSQSGVPVLEAVTFGVFAEVQRAHVARRLGRPRASGAATSACGTSRPRTRRSSAQLAEAQIAAAGAARARRSQPRPREAARAARSRRTCKTAAAEIIAAGATPDFRTVTIDKGTQRRLAAGHGGHRAGRRRRPGRRAEPARGEGAAADRPQRRGRRARSSDRARRASSSAPATTRLRMEYVSEVADVVVGDVVVTSGIDGIYPKGFVIGRVESVEKSGGAYKRILVRPAVDFSSLEEVLVVLTPTPAREARRGGRRVKAAGVVLAVAAGPRAADHAGPLHRRGTRGGRPGAGRGGLRRADVGAGRRPADRHVRRAGAGRAVDAASSASAGWPRRWSGFWPASSARSSSSRSRCRGLSCFSARRCSTRWYSSGCTCCSDLRHFGTPYAAVAGQALGNAVVGVVAFQLAELLPGAVERRRARSAAAIRPVSMDDSWQVVMKIAAASRLG